MRELTICFVARNDFVAKPGGDTQQWRLYRAAAVAAGMKCVDWFDSGPMPHADIFHCLNIDRPLEIYPKMRRAADLRKPFLITTIHHPNPWVERFRAVEPPGGILGRMLYASPMGRTVEGSESIKEVVRIVRQGRLREFTALFPSWTSRVRWLIKTARKVLLASPAEGDHLSSDFRADLAVGQREILPNWVEGLPDAGTASPAAADEWPEPPVLVVGRIETRKNARRLARIAEEVRRPTLFIGRPNPNEPGYVASFKNILQGGRFARWLPGVERTELACHYSNASFLLTASYAEVSPHVDIEALGFGCPVATTRYALHHDMLPAGTPQCDAYDEAQLAERLRWRPSRMQAVHVANGADCRRKLAALYLEVANAG